MIDAVYRSFMIDEVYRSFMIDAAFPVRRPLTEAAELGRE